MSDDTKRLLELIDKVVDNLYISLINNGAVERLTKALESVENGKIVDKNITFVRITESMLSEINVIRELQKKDPLTERNIIAFSGAINNHLTNHIREYGSARNVAQAAFDVLTSADTLAMPSKLAEGNKGTLLIKKNVDRFADSVTLGNTEEGRTSLKDISPRSRRQTKKLSKEKANSLKQSGG